jgi:hypothetical protein
MPGEHTREIGQALLDLDADEIERLITENVLFAWSDPTEETGSTS